jgi:hypothetical protein
MAACAAPDRSVPCPYRIAIIHNRSVGTRHWCVRHTGTTKNQIPTPVKIEGVRANLQAKHACLSSYSYTDEYPLHPYDVLVVYQPRHIYIAQRE